MWNSKSPGVETAWRAPERISRNGWSLAGRGDPKSRSQASDPKAMTQERPASRSRNSTARNNAARSPQNDRRVARLSKPGFTVATRKIAARVSGAPTGCAMDRRPLPVSRGLIGSGFIWMSSLQGVGLRRACEGCRQAYHPLTRNVHVGRHHNIFMVSPGSCYRTEGLRSRFCRFEAPRASLGCKVKRLAICDH